LNGSVLGGDPVTPVVRRLSLKLMRYKIPIGCAGFIALLAIAIPTLRPVLRRAELSRRTEADYRKFVESGSDQIYSYYPELFDRISADQNVANRIRLVHLTGVDSSGDYSSLGRLPNVEAIEVTYAHEVRSVVPAINTMPSLKRAMFYYCGQTEVWLRELNSPTLEIVKIHVYQAQQVSADDVEACQAKMPSCRIFVTEDGDK
jgi:hypothetical protein